ncbi:hypothetical protein AMECASPLE_033827 [Ameca splendens]|uniref:Uncharacterized protein n=1 Tax=Ameca splendens TaxID=208324 RepID=A0ABV0XK08_9TELE
MLRREFSHLIQECWGRDAFKICRIVALQDWTWAPSPTFYSNSSDKSIVICLHQVVFSSIFPLTLTSLFVTAETFSQHDATTMFHHGDGIFQLMSSYFFSHL